MSPVRAILPALLAVAAALGPVSTEAQLMSAACAPHLTLLAHGYGSPDDVAVQGSRILFGDLTRNVLAAESKGRVTTLVSGLQVPEGIVVQSPHRVVVVEQGANRLDTIDLATGRRQVLKTFPNQTGREGIDGIAPAPNGGIYVPDSPHGRLYLLDKHGRLHLLAGGLGRPVDAIRFDGGIAVADETANAIWLVAHGRARRLATVPTPDDVAVFHGRLLAVTLGDGKLWEVRPAVKPLVSSFGQPQGLAVLNNSAVVVADSSSNGLYAVANLQSCW
jgi:hypothetical protein